MKIRTWTGILLSGAFGEALYIAGHPITSGYYWLLLAIFIVYGATERHLK